MKCTKMLRYSGEKILKLQKISSQNKSHHYSNSCTNKEVGSVY